MLRYANSYECMSCEPSYANGAHNYGNGGLLRSGEAAPNGTETHAISTSTSSVFPRSASEALFDSTSKFRQLPCRTFISVGTCPYRERCVYLHDPRCICRDAKTKTRRKNKEDVVLDSMFWPVMPYSMVSGKQDTNRQPHVIQSYAVPLPQNDQYNRHDSSVYSMWMHFVDFCLANNETHNAPHADAAVCYCAPETATNSYTGHPRLPVFQSLSMARARNESIAAAAHHHKAVAPPPQHRPLPMQQHQHQQVPVYAPPAQAATSPVTVASPMESPQRSQLPLPLNAHPHAQRARLPHAHPSSVPCAPQQQKQQVQGHTSFPAVLQGFDSMWKQDCAAPAAGHLVDPRCALSSRSSSFNSHSAGVTTNASSGLSTPRSISPPTALACKQMQELLPDAVVVDNEEALYAFLQ